MDWGELFFMVLDFHRIYVDSPCFVYAFENAVCIMLLTESFSILKLYFRPSCRSMVAKFIYAD